MKKLISIALLSLMFMMSGLSWRPDFWDEIVTLMIKGEHT